MKTKLLFMLIVCCALRTASVAQSGAACDGSGMLSITGTTVVSPNCEGGTDGSISLVVSGPGAASYTYTLTGAASNPPAPAVTGSTAHQFTDLEAIGFYVLEVRTPVDPSDPNTNYYSCVQIINMSPKPALSVSGSTDPPTCASGSDGNIDLNITNGTAPYQINWSDGGTGTNRSNVPQGNYSVTVTDANGCTGSSSFTITDPTPITVTPATTMITCNGDDNGSVSFSASGGTAPYTYTSDAGTGTSISDLTPGTYSVTATDAKACSTSVSFTITEPPVLSAVIDPIPPLKCNGDKDRTITITGTGGTAPYQYTMDGTENSQSGSSANFSNNGEGSGSITIEDANGCTASIPFSISGPPPAEFPLTMTKDDCSEGSGNIQSFSPATGGNGGPYTYQYSANAGPYVPFTPPQDFGVTDGITTAGENVSVKVTDKEGCEYNFSSTIENLPRAVPYIHIERNPCIGNTLGSITVDSVLNNASVPAYTFYLAKDDGTENFVNQPGSGPHGESAHFGNLTSQGYIMQIEDGKPCGPYAVSEFFLWNGTHYELVTAGSLYTRDDGTGNDTVSAASTHSPDHAVMQVIDPDPFQLSTISHASEIHETTGQIWVYDIQGGTPKMIQGNPAYLMAIDNPAAMEYYILKDTLINNTSEHLYAHFGYFAPGMHTLYLSDTNGCMDTIQIMVTGDFFIPNLITPNGDGHNDTFEIISLPPQSTLKILNRWGDRIYESSNYDNSFSGSGNSDGIYYYELELRSGDRFKGWLQVLR